MNLVRAYAVTLNELEPTANSEFSDMVQCKHLEREEDIKSEERKLRR